MALSNLKKKAKEAYSRILLNKFTATFVVFSFVLCLAQGIIQSFLFSVDSEYKGLLYDIVDTVNSASLLNITEIPSQFYIDNIPLLLCSDVPIGALKRERNCSVLFDTSRPDPVISQPALVLNKVAFNREDHIVSVINSTGRGRDVGQTCAQTLLYAHQNLRNFSSEDLTFILLQFWLLGISVLAVTNDSVAHLLTTIMTRALMTAWSAYSLWRTHNFTVIFRKLYADPGTPCNIDFFSNYFTTRLAYETPDLVLNVIGFSVISWLSWRLLGMYNAQALRYVGAPEHINRINKLFLAVLSCLQLEVFMLLTVMGLWIDVLLNTAIKRISAHTPAYLGVFVSTSVILIPWITLGWYSIKREMRRAILVFFFLAFVIILGWSIMFYSLVYRWTFLQWPFLAGCSVSSFVLIVSSTALAIICRLNFGKGLKQYLAAEAALANSGFAPEVFRHDEEKNAPFDLETADYKHSSFDPTSPTTKYEQAVPTYIAQPMPHNRSGPTGTSPTEGRQANALEAPLEIPGLAERPARVPVAALKYNHKTGESF
ncbi:hypothetical protein D9756_008120 [Leucocoprinus leucothites]|uniref:Uncharacterized protein n=1 Tax=Leucocoprinus leucothites TaxID=201217 RepID=A0A8H5D689_9AGAR|nr:hypothetical protein D9756_008120 [Leucoagaricus leucothites]